MTTTLTLNELATLYDEIEEYMTSNNLHDDDLPEAILGHDAKTITRALAVGAFLAQVYEANEGAGNFTKREMVRLVKIAFGKDYKD